MKTKTRNTIGKILFFGGLIFPAYLAYDILEQSSGAFLPQVGYYLFASLGLIILGALWGMKRK